MLTRACRTVALSLVALFLPSPVQAQSQPASATATVGALDALVVTGLRRSLEPAVTGLLGFTPGDALTRTDISRARRRLADLPSGGMPSLDLSSPSQGVVTLEANADERRVLPHGPIGWAPVVVRVITSREIRFDVAGLARHGELWQPTYRWDSDRPRLGLDIAIPAPSRVPGILRAEASWERQTYSQPGATDTTFLEERRRFGASLGDWATDWIRWQVGVFSDRFDNDNHVATSAELGTRLFADHVWTTVHLARWIPTNSSHPVFATAHVASAWRSTTRRDRARWTVRAGATHVTAASPFALWPGASSGAGRGILLRAHPLLEDDIVTGEVFGRQVAFANVEHQTPVLERPYATVAVAGFLDLARAWHRLDRPDPSQVHADLGAGVRVVPAGSNTTIRMDLAVGVRDGRVRASIGYLAGWGR